MIGLNEQKNPQKTASPYLYVPLLVYEQVLRLQVSVDQVQSVQVFEGQDYLGSVKPGVRLTARKKEGRDVGSQRNQHNGQGKKKRSMPTPT